MSSPRPVKLDFVVDPLRPDLGGNIRHGDPATFSPKVWRYVIDSLGIRSVLDVGSGEGYAAQWFARQGLVSYACDGLMDNVLRAVHPTIHLDLVAARLVCPVDLVHCVEVLEHINPDHLGNLMATLANGKHVLVTHAAPGQDGHHHVNCQPSTYWVERFAEIGYTLVEPHTACIRKIAATEHVTTFFAQSGLLFGRNNEPN